MAQSWRLATNLLVLVFFYPFFVRDFIVSFVIARHLAYHVNCCLDDVSVYILEARLSGEDLRVDDCRCASHVIVKLLLLQICLGDVNPYISVAILSGNVLNLDDFLCHVQEAIMLTRNLLIRILLLQTCLGDINSCNFVLRVNGESLQIRKIMWASEITTATKLTSERFLIQLFVLQT